MSGTGVTPGEALERLAIERDAWAAVQAGAPVPDTWARPFGYTGPCPECKSTTCRGYYRPDHDHFLAF